MAMFFLLIAGCGSIFQQDAVGAGYEEDELKISPCACIQVEQVSSQSAGLWAITG